MLIKFKAPDPRAGTVAQMDSSRGQHFIDAGSADPMKEGAQGEEVTPPSGDEKPPVKPSEGLKVEELRAALTAKGIEIPDGAKKAELAALLDAA